MKTQPRILALTALTALTALLAPATAPAQAGLLQPAPDPKKVHEDVTAALAADGTARVIVRLDLDVPKNGEVTRAALAALDAQVADAQAAVRRKLGAMQFQERAALRHLPLLVVEGGAEVVTALSAISGVRSIRLDGLSAPTLANSVPQVKANTAWRMGGDRGRSGVVAVLDTGFDLDHPFFGDRIVDEACFSDSDQGSLCPDGDTEQEGPGAAQNCVGLDGCDHGSHVAGIAAGSSAASSGVAPAASLALFQVFHRVDSARVCDDDPSPCLRSHDADALRALERVLDLRVDGNLPIRAVNMSFGSRSFTTTRRCQAVDPGFEDAVALLNRAGVAVVGTSGNNARDDAGNFVSGVGFPGCVPGVVTVGSVDRFDTVSDFSQAGDLLDLLAPGDAITSSVPDNADDIMGGTSMAAPHVAGGIALLAEMFPAASPSLLVSTLRATGVAVNDGRSGAVFTFRRMDLEAAARQLALTWPLPTVTAPTNLRLEGAPTRTTAGFRFNDTTDREFRFELAVDLPNGVNQAVVQVPATELGRTTQTTSVGNLSRGTDYVARVRACDAFNRCSAYSPSLPFRTFIQLPSAPTGLRVVSKNTTQINLGWNAQAGLTGFTLNAWGGTVAGGASNLAAAATSASAGGRRPGETYHFSLRACNADGCGPEATVSATTDLLMAPPAAPSALTLLGAPAGQVSLRWTDNANNEAGVEVWRALATPGFGGNPDNPTWSPQVTTAANVTTYASANGPVNTIRYYKVRACNAGGCSAYSNVVTQF